MILRIIFALIVVVPAALGRNNISVIQFTALLTENDTALVACKKECSVFLYLQPSLVRSLYTQAKGEHSCFCASSNNLSTSASSLKTLMLTTISPWNSPSCKKTPNIT